MKLTETRLRVFVVVMWAICAGAVVYFTIR